MGRHCGPDGILTYLVPDFDIGYVCEKHDRAYEKAMHLTRGDRRKARIAADRHLRRGIIRHGRKKAAAIPDPRFTGWLRPLNLVARPAGSAARAATRTAYTLLGVTYWSACRALGGLYLNRCARKAGS